MKGLVQTGDQEPDGHSLSSMKKKKINKMIT